MISKMKNTRFFYQFARIFAGVEDLVVDIEKEQGRTRICEMAITCTSVAALRPEREHLVSTLSFEWLIKSEILCRA